QVRSPHVLIVGHPYIDVWAAVKPSAVGIRAWPDVPRGMPWKEGVMSALGWREESTGAAWRRIITAVHTYADLEPALLGRVEELSDCVTAAREQGDPRAGPCQGARRGRPRPRRRAGGPAG